MHAHELSSIDTVRLLVFFLRSLSSISSGFLSPLVLFLFSCPTPFTYSLHTTSAAPRRTPTGGRSQLRVQLHPARFSSLAAMRVTCEVRSD